MEEVQRKDEFENLSGVGDNRSAHLAAAKIAENLESTNQMSQDSRLSCINPFSLAGWNTMPSRWASGRSWGERPRASRLRPRAGAHCPW